MTGSGQGRDAVIDALRGACIVSMMLSHLADGSLVSEAVHAPPWINGATGFVLLSGLVIGSVQRRVDEPEGLRKLGRRARLVYGWHVGLLVLALVLAPLRYHQPGRPPLPTAEQAGGWPAALWRAVTLQLNPAMLDILSMYVVLFAVAAGALALMRRRLTWLAVAASVVLWWFALSTGWGSPSGALGREAGFNPMTWQALFVSGLVAGWHWRAGAWSFVDVAARRRWWVRSVQAAAVLFVVGQLVVHLGLAHGDSWGARTLDLLTGRRDLGPVRFLLGWIYLAALYPLLRHGWTSWPVRWFRAVVDPVGRRSLDSFVIMTLVLIVLPTIWAYDMRSWSGVVVAVATLAAAWTWATWRDRQRSVRPTPVRESSAAAVLVH